MPEALENKSSRPLVSILKEEFEACKNVGKKFSHFDNPPEPFTMSTRVRENGIWILFYFFFLPAGQKERENKIETKYGVYDTHVPGVSVLHFCLPPMVGVATQSAWEKQFLFLLRLYFSFLFYPLVSCYLGGINDVERRSFISLIGILFLFFFFCGKKKREFRRNPG